MSEKSVTGCSHKPTMHQDFAVGTKVRVARMLPSYDGLEGVITGVASMHVIFIYIITLKEPLNIPGHEGWTTIAVNGGQLNAI